MGKIESFTDLEVWKQAHQLALDVYKVTKQFPQEERYALVDQDAHYRSLQISLKDFQDKAKKKSSNSILLQRALSQNYKINFCFLEI